MRRPPPRSPLFPYTALSHSPPAGRAVFDSILEQIMEHLLQTQFVAFQHEWLSWAAKMQRMAFRYDLGRVHHSLRQDRKSTRLNSSHANISYAVFCLKKKKHT